jgi:hypothetical protein
MHKSKPVLSTPMCSTVKLSAIDRPSFEDQYLSFTRPDLSFAINKVYQFMHYPRVSLIDRLSGVFYAISITRLTLVSTFPHLLRLNLLPSQMPIGQGVQMTANQSTGGFCVYFGSHLISWGSKKQPMP